MVLGRRRLKFAKIIPAYCKILLKYIGPLRLKYVFWISGSSDTNQHSLLQNTTYTGPPRLKNLQGSDTNLTA